MRYVFNRNYQIILEKTFFKHFHAFYGDFVTLQCYY